MNTATARRRALAARNASIYAADPNVAAVFLVGSTARGQCDAFSDIDMIVTWQKMPEEETLARARAALGATDWRQLAREEEDATESFVVEGIECQVGHSTRAKLEEILDDVLIRFDTDHDKHTIMGGLQDALPLHGTPLVEAWRDRAADYPDGLARAMVEKHLRFAPGWFLERRIAGRETLFVFYQALIQMQRDLMGVLLGLNRLYPEHDFKRIDRLIGRMGVAPRDLERRLKGILRAEYGEAVAELAALIDEVLGLVERQRPEIDLTGVRSRLERPAPEPDEA